MLRRYFGKISSLGINQLVGHNGELVIDELTDKIYIMDGVTPAGYEIANIQHYGSKIFFDNGTTIGPNNDGDNSISVTASSDNDFVEINYADSQIVRANADAVSIVTDSLNIGNEWKFDNSGTTIFPGGFQIDPYTFTDQTLIFPGAISNVSTKGIYLTTGEITNTIYIPGTNFEEATGTGINTDPVGISGKNGVNISAGADGQGHDQHSWIFGTEGKLTLPAGKTYEYFDVPLTGAGNGLAQVDFTLSTNGVETEWIAANANPAGLGYNPGDTFEFDEQFLGIPGASLTIEVLSAGPGGSIQELEFTPPPLYPADIYRDSPVILQVGNEGRWVFGIGGSLSIPGEIKRGNSGLSIFNDGGIYLSTDLNDDNNALYFDNTTKDVDLYVAGDVRLSAGTVVGESQQMWTFDTAGIINLPNNNGQIGQLESPYTGLEFRTGSGADWIGISYGEINDNNTSYFYFDKDGSDYLTANHRAHLQIKNPAHNGHVEWLFDSNGNLKFPQGTLLGYSDPGGFIIDGAADKDIAIYTYNGANAYGWTFGTDAMLELPTSLQAGFAAGIKFSDGSIQTKAYTDFGSNSLVSGDSAQYVVNLDNDGILHLSGTAQGEYESAIVAPNLQLDGSIVENIGSRYINIFGNTVVQGGNLALSGLFDDSYLWLVNTDNAIHTHSDTGIGGHATTEYRNMGGYLEGGRGHRFYTGGTWDQQQLRFAIADDGILVPGDMYLTGQIRDFTGRNLLNPLNLNIDAGDSSTVYDTTDLIIDGGNS